MKNSYVGVFCLLFLLIPGYSLFSQNVKHQASVGLKQNTNGLAPYAKPKWTIADPFEQKVFIENNEGQFDGRTSSDKDKVLFSTRINEVYLYFTSTSITYRYDKYPVMDNDGKEKGKDKDPDEKMAKPETHFFSVNWDGANEKTDVLAEDEVSFYYTYPKNNQHTTIAHAFKKLLYKNIYPGIDIEYSFPEEKKGLEYSIIVHPGADISKVKMIYNNVGRMKEDAAGDIESESSFGQFVDHAPAKTFYQDGSGNASCAFKLKGKEVTYAANYDHSKTLVIDPWMVNPGFTNYNAGYDVCWDLRGNVYSYGSFAPYQEIKINSAGVIQWIFSIPNVDPQYGDFAVDEATGISFDGSCTFPYIYKVDTAGLQTGLYWINNNMEELWRMAFNKCENQLVIAGGGVGLINQACTLDTGFTTLNPVNVLSAGGGHNDMNLLTIDNDNSSVFMTSAANGFGNLYPNDVMRCMLPSLAPTTYLTHEGFNFDEGVTGPTYVNGVWGHGFGMNGAVTNASWLYLYDGANLLRINKNTGTTVSTKAITATSFGWGGLDVDVCNNLYLGNTTNISVYDSSLNNIGTITAPNTVYDLHIAPNNILVASGLGFVSTFNITTNPVLVSFVYNPCLNPGEVTANLSSCGNDSAYTYLWSNGATTQTVTGLTPGTYTVSITASCDFVYTDSVVVTNAASGGITLSTPTTICAGASETITAGGGSSYQWTNGATTSSITVSPTTTKTYSVLVSTAGCGNIDTSITIPVDPGPTLITPSPADSICAGQTVVLNVSGAKTYSWSPTTGLSCTTCPNPTDSVTTSTTYIVTGYDSLGCSATKTIGVVVEPNPELGTIPDQTICAGSVATLVPYSLLGYGGTYTWLPGGSTTATIDVSPTTTTTYTLQLSNKCGIINNTVTVFVNPMPKPFFTAEVTSGCAPLCIQFRDESIISSPGSVTGWSWIFGDGDTAYSRDPVYCYQDTGTYTVTHTAVSDKGCSATLQIVKMITVYSKPIANFIYSPQVINYLEPDVQFTDKSTDKYGIVYWTWNFGDNSPIDLTNSMENPAHSYGDTGAFCPQLMVVNEKGCVDTTTECLYVDPIFTLYIPSAFSPNGDGINDLFAPKGSFIKTFEMYIFDRWGMELYHTNDINKGWDGTVKGGSTICQEDSYVYKILATDWSNDQHSYIGEFTLVK